MTGHRRVPLSRSCHGSPRSITQRQYGFLHHLVVLRVMADVRPSPLVLVSAAMAPAEQPEQHEEENNKGGDGQVMGLLTNEMDGQRQVGISMRQPSMLVLHH
jgi:hypothetical protein